MKIKSKLLLLYIIWFSFLMPTYTLSPSVSVKADDILESVKEPNLIQLIPMNVPDIDSSFKTYMDYRTIASTSSSQYKLIKEWAWCDDNGFMRINGERDYGINDDYYVVALGSYYGSCIGTKYKIITDTGNVFYVILGDQKSDKHTNPTNQYSFNNDIIEFIIKTDCLNKNVRKMGSANVYMPLNGSIVSIERIEFIKK